MNKTDIPSPSTHNVNEMGSKRIALLIPKFSLPAIIGLLCNGLQNIINRAFVGNVEGSIALSGVALIYPIMMIYMALAAMIGVGSTILASIRLGQKRKDDAEALLGQSTLLLFIIPVAAIIPLEMFKEPLLLMMGATPEALPYACDYLSVILVAMIVSCPCMGVNNFIRTEGQPKISMLTQILTAVIIVITNYIFVVRLGWGVKGAAFGVLIGNFVALIWVLSYFTTKHSYLRLRVNNLRINLRSLGKISLLGMAPFLMQCAGSIQQLVLNRTLSDIGGNDALSTIAIVTSLSSLLVLPMVGVNNGAQPIIGYNYGAKNYSRIKETVRCAMLWAVAFAFISFIVVQLWAEPLSSIFAKEEPHVIEMTSRALRLYFLAMPLVGITVTSSGYFQAMGHPFISAAISMSRQVLIFIPLILILPQYLGIDGIWLASPIGDVVACLFSATALFFSLRRLNKLTLGEVTEKVI